MKKTYIASAVCLAAAIALAGCGPTGPAKDGETLIIANAGDPRSLDPALTNDSASSEIMKQVYNTLFDLDYSTMEAVPSLAEDYAFENDAAGRPTILRIFLRQGVLFHNGDELKASDIKFNLDRAKVSPQISEIAGMIDRTEVVGDYELVIYLQFPFMPILNNLAHTAMSIVSEKAVTQAGDSYDRNPIGTGPMKFVSWVKGDRIELTRWDQYWGEKPRIKNITMRYILDPATRIAELKAGGVDISLALQPQDIPGIEANPDLQMVRGYNLSLNFIGFNMQNEHFKDVRVRQAIAHAIDLDALQSSVFMGVGRPGRGPLPSTVWASAAEELPQYEYNPEKAKQLLAEAGYPDGFSTRIVTNDGNAMRLNTAVAVQAMLKDVGIDLEVRPVEWAAFLEMLDKGDSQMFMLGWVTVTGDPDYGLEIFHTRSFGPGGNYSFFSSPEVDGLLDRARQETNTDRRKEMYIEAQHLIQAGAPLIYTLEGEDLVAIRKNVRGFELSPAGHHSYYAAWLEQ